MADTKISALTAAANAAGANEIPINEAGTTKKVTVTQIATAILPVKAAGSDITTGTDDAKFLTSKALADAAVGKIGAAWTAFTPTWTNLTVGAGGTNTGAYTQIGKTVFFRVLFQFGTGSAVGTSPTLTLPVSTASYGAITTMIGTVNLIDAGVGYFNGSIDNAGLITYLSTTGVTNLGRYQGITATAPWTWTTNDGITIEGCYQAA
jgi:hypothetical protein